MIAFPRPAALPCKPGAGACWTVVSTLFTPFFKGVSTMQKDKCKVADKYRVLDSTGKTKGYVRATSWIEALQEALKWHGWDVTVAYVKR